MTRKALAWTAMLTLLVAPLAAADGEGDDEKGDDDKQKERRESRVVVEGDKVVIKLKNESDGQESKLKLVYDADEARMKVSYEIENATSESETEMKVRFKRVVEFADANGDGAYDPKTDREVARYDSDDLRWRIEGPTDVTSGDGVPGKRVTGIGTFPGGIGNLSLVLYAYGDFARVNGTPVAPTEVKIDILLDDFPYKENGTRPAILVKAETETEVEGDALSAPLGGATARFAWASQALVDGTMTPVKDVVTKDKNETEDGKTKLESSVWFAYARGAHINHDPTMGIASASAREVPMPPALLAVALAVAVTIVVRSSRR